MRWMLDYFFSRRQPHVVECYLFVAMQSKPPQYFFLPWFMYIVSYVSLGLDALLGFT
jgi:hypothetical protein